MSDFPAGEQPDGEHVPTATDLNDQHNASLSDRAARRRAAREAKERKPFDQATQQTLPHIAHRVNQHNLMCERCRSGNVVKRGCPGLDRLYLENAEEIHKMLGLTELVEEAKGVEEDPED